ncbi:MAG: hypothetical protein AAB455_03150 [Patescibacteria group bacterium]
MQAILKFKTKLEIDLGLPTFLEDESLTSREAGYELGQDAMLDARAAAIILRSFIERQRNKK